MPTKKSEPSRKGVSEKIDAKVAVEVLEYLLAAGYVNKKKLYYENFMRGIFFSVGSIIGATIVLALLFWILSLFDNVPVIDGFVKALQRTVDSRR